MAAEVPAVAVETARAVVGSMKGIEQITIYGMI